MSFKLTKMSFALASSCFLFACGGSGGSEPEVVEPPVVVQPDPDPVAELEPELTLEVAVENIYLTEEFMFHVDVPADAATLTVSFAKGVAGKDLGDPDLYIRYGEEPTKGENGSFDCISFNQSGWQEDCIIDQPQAGRYYILVDAYDQGDGVGVTDGTLWASTALFPTGKACDEPINLRAQEMTEEELTESCDILSETKVRFDEVLNSGITPDFQEPVPNDLNEYTGINIFANLANHKAWMTYLYRSENTSGIYFENDPTDYFHNSVINTFNALEWSDGRHVIRSLAHEYVHALDGRYNKEGGYKKNMAWWSEGLAEYLGTFYQEPYQLFEIAHENEDDTNKYTLAEIFDLHNNDYVPSAYDWGYMAVAFLLEKHPSDVTTMIAHMRAGEWTEYEALLDMFVVNYEAEFVDYYTHETRANYEASAKNLPLDSYLKVEGRGGWLFSVEVPAGVSDITLATTGGSGDIELMASKDVVPHTSFDVQPECNTRPQNNSGNEESCTFTDVTPGTYYVLANSDFVGADIVDMYITACSGEDCTIDVPAQEARKTITQPNLPVGN